MVKHPIMWLANKKGIHWALCVLCYRRLNFDKFDLFNYYVSAVYVGVWCVWEILYLIPIPSLYHSFVDLKLIFLLFIFCCGIFFVILKFIEIFFSTLHCYCLLLPSLTCYCPYSFGLHRHTTRTHFIRKG